MGSGSAAIPPTDAIAAAPMPTWRGLLARWPHSVLRASEDAVGLPAGQMGNSEVGHLNLGAGRPVLQDLPRIDAAIADGSFFERPAFLAACARARETGGVLSIVSLIGPGGVHANDRHLVALAELARREDVAHRPRPRAARRPRHAAPLGPRVHRGPRGAAGRRPSRMPSSRRVGGRYFAMDRDHRWDRVERGYDAIVHGVGERAASATAAIEAAYVRGEDDEFVAPTVIDGVDDRPGRRRPVIHANFRADRARQLTHALADPVFDGFDRTSPDGRARPDRPARRDDDRLRGRSAGPGRVPARGGPIRSPRPSPRPAGASRTSPRPRSTPTSRTSSTVASSRRIPGEERVLVPSPKVATYDLAPAMSADGRDGRPRRGHRARTASTSSSPTTPTRTWSATPGRGTRR